MSWILREEVLIPLMLAVAYVIYFFYPVKKTEDNEKEDDEIILPPITHDDWGLIVGAPYAVYADDAVNDFSPCTDADDYRMQSSWGISNRQDLIYQLFNRIQGGHATNYDALRNQVVGLSKNEFDTLLKRMEEDELDDDEYHELQWQYHMMHNNTNDIQNVNYWAWDYVRFSMLCLRGIKFRYLTEEEAKAWTRMLAPRLREIYTGWDDLWQHFITTRWFWSNEQEPWQSSASDYLAAIHQLLQDKHSPANVIAWDTPLSSTDTLSFAEALVSIQQIKNEDGELADVDEVNSVIRWHLKMTESE
ncbi:DUF1266 domain-containing protein [Xenorhabdus bovienii]|uniref:DUF1266 domain-containing protein n=1 Tax=Xenorhabdus bovienii TaxID=40576 RepID=UPI0023B2D23D|nr:DUF1266 domain-containing protein [Xenorhabdus bovienii]MDE9463288.1 DUF1266 domain-containing protein [Xenorhabdus bovienii]MDE9471081.1 DUF1266 domain-containing protein [Xenorhabdus bovienii]MDE9553315.1 DUF1266 domain-containing protein [Xenorhabdus bovienii]